MRHQKGVGTPAVVLLVVAALVVAEAGVLYAFYHPSAPRSGASTTPTTTSTTSSTCSGYPPGGNCVAPYSYTFGVTVDYSGSWSLTYRGQTDVGEPDAHYINGTDAGMGTTVVPVKLTGLNTVELLLCAQAQKLDGSGSTLALTIIGEHNETSAPFGSVSACAGVAP